MKILCPGKLIVLLLALGIYFTYCGLAEAQSKFPASEWMKKDTKFKLELVQGFISVAREDGVKIRFPAEYYVKEVDSIIQNSIRNHDEKGLGTSVGKMIHTIAAMDGDWDNGENRLEHARKYLGPKYFEFFKDHFPQKYARLRQDRTEYSDFWKQFGYSGKNTLVYYDEASISYTSKTVVRVWVKARYINAEEGLNDLIKGGFDKSKCEKYDHNLNLYKIDCAGNKWAVLASYMYGKDGALIDAADFPERPVVLTPGSVIDALAKTVCLESNENKSPIDQKGD